MINVEPTVNLQPRKKENRQGGRTMTKDDIRPGGHYKHKEANRTPHIVLYIGIHTDTKEPLVVHRPMDKHHTIYCETIESFIDRFELI